MHGHGCLGVASYTANGNPRERQAWEEHMALTSRRLTVAFGVLALMTTATTAFAQKPGGILRQHIIDSPASMSIHEATTVVAERPMMAVLTNLVMFDPHVAQN